MPYDSYKHLLAGRMVVQLLQDLAMPQDLKKQDWDTVRLKPSLLVRVRNSGHGLAACLECSVIVLSRQEIICQ